jgi:hypothetical protein
MFRTHLYLITILIRRTSGRDLGTYKQTNDHSEGSIGNKSTFFNARRVDNVWKGTEICVILHVISEVILVFQVLLVAFRRPNGFCHVYVTVHRESKAKKETNKMQLI